MAPEPQSNDGSFKHRPLPSVDVALLPHELRASRARMLALITLVAAATVGGAVAFAFARGWFGEVATEDAPVEHSDPWPSEVGGKAPSVSAAPPDETATAAATEPAQAPAEPAAEEQTDEAPEAAEQDEVEPGVTTHSFGDARGFRDALLNTGASPDEANALVTALDKLVDFRRCRPEHQLVYERGPDGVLSAFEYRLGITESFRAERAADGSYDAEKVEVPIERRRIARGGYVSGSLGQALEAMGLGRSLAGVFVEAFEGKIDFKKHTRAGDAFRLIVEEQFVEGTFLGYGDVQGLEYRGEKSGKHEAYWFDHPKGKGDFYDPTGRAIHGGWLRTPLRYDHVSSGFNPRRRHPILKRIVPHNGIDYAAAPGTPVWAAADGVVTFAGRRGANGNLIAISHAGGYETFYAHLSRIGRGIAKGVEVSQRHPIGAVGSTGRSTGPHLHFALKRRGRFIDPARQLNGPGQPLPSSLMPRFKQQMKGTRHELDAIPLSPAPEPGGAEPEAGGEEVFHEDALDL